MIQTNCKHLCSFLGPYIHGCGAPCGRSSPATASPRRGGHGRSWPVTAGHGGSLPYPCPGGAPRVVPGRAARREAPTAPGRRCADRSRVPGTGTAKRLTCAGEGPPGGQADAGPAGFRLSGTDPDRARPGKSGVFEIARRALKCDY